MPCTAVEAALRIVCGDGCLSCLSLPWLAVSWLCLVWDALASSADALERCSAR